MSAEIPTTRRSVPGIQIECFNLCQTIGMEIVERGHGITANAVHFPVTHSQVKSSLEALKAFTERALVAIDVAQSEWRKEHASGN